MTAHPSPRRGLLVVSFVLACALPSSACITHHVYQIGGPLGLEQGNQPGTEWEGKTLHALVWGAVLRQDLPIDTCKLGDGTRLGIEEIKIDKNFGHVLASVLTIGLWQPVKVSWRCARPPVPTGTLPWDQP